jgi:hypothetical protein
MSPAELKAFRTRCEIALKDGWFMAGEFLDVLKRLEDLEWANIELSNQVNDLQLELSEYSKESA